MIETKIPPTRTLLIAMLIVSLCALIYELLIASTLSYLIGESVLCFSVTIGLFLLSMGFGAYISQLVKRDAVEAFLSVEILIGLVGGLAVPSLFGTAALFALNDAVSSFSGFLQYILRTVYPLMASAGLLIIVIGTLIGVEIPLLLRIANRNKRYERNIANVLGADYVGAFVGSLVFPLLLLPRFGLIRTGFFIGLLNTAVAAVVAWRFRILSVRVIVVLLLTFAILTTGFCANPRIEGMIDQWLYASNDHTRVLLSDWTPYQKIVLTRYDDGETASTNLFLNGTWQFCSRIFHIYHEGVTHPAMTLSGSPRDVLVLGGGDGIVLREILKYPSVERVKLVDIDEQMIRLAREHPEFLRLNGRRILDPRVEVVIDDGIHYVLRHPERFDAIIMDFPWYNAELVSKMFSVQFFRGIYHLLREDGVFQIGFNSSMPVQLVVNSVRRAGLHAAFFRRAGKRPDDALARSVWDMPFLLLAREPIPNDDLRNLRLAIPTHGPFLLEPLSPAQTERAFRRNVYGFHRGEVNTIYRPLLVSSIRDRGFPYPTYTLYGRASELH